MGNIFESLFIKSELKMKNEKVIGIDLGGTNIKAGIVNREGKIIKKIAVATNAQKGPNEILNRIYLAIDSLLKKNNFKIKGIGIGLPGIVEASTGLVKNPPNLPGWKSVPIGKLLKSRYNLPVFVENDANAAAIGELIFGSGKNLNSFIFVTLGTGVGGGIIINKKLFRGSSGGAGELGHISINHNGPKCNCGSRGCIEAYLGNNYLVRRMKGRLKNNPNSLTALLMRENNNELTPYLINLAAKRGDELAINFIAESGRLLGFALSSAINLFDIHNVIIGGGVSGFGRLLTKPALEAIKERVLAPLKSKVSIKLAKLKNNAGIQGASALIFYNIG